MNGSLRTPEEYLKEPYARVLLPDEETGTYAAEILEFSGCVAQGDTPEEAYTNLEEAAKGWIQAALDLDQDIPEPAMNQGYGGRVALRLPRGLHRRAAQMAEREGTSLNQFLVAAVAERVGVGSLYERLTQRLAHWSMQAATETAIKIMRRADTTEPWELSQDVTEMHFLNEKASTPTSMASNVVIGPGSTNVINVGPFRKPRLEAALSESG